MADNFSNDIPIVLNCNRPFAAVGHMVQNPKYWRANYDKTPLGNINKEKSHFSS